MRDLTLDRRRWLLGSSALLCLPAASADLVEALQPRTGQGIDWYDPQQWGAEGRGWQETARYYDRLPSRAEEEVRGAVWSLSRHSAGMTVRFQTDATDIHVRYRLLSPRLAMPHMPATGVSGVDLYVRDAAGTDRWLAVSMPKSQDVESKLVAGVDPPADSAQRLFTLYLPLYNGLERLEIGVPAGASFTPESPRSEKPLVFYGTSIMHGACASRPGMSITGILGRRLDRPVINLGFSGNGRMEKAVGDLLAELDAAVYVVDCLPNMQGDEVRQRAVRLVEQLRRARPKTPILLVEDRTYGYAHLQKGSRQRQRQSRLALREAFGQLTGAGLSGLSYLSGAGLLGSDGEATTDGSHPNDLGMVRYADAYEPILREILEGTA
ncbi:MAG: hypothetical protein CMJ75_08855 [Planctomycetaceae bacterium]|nr:hypothetical protein [Planctomycetaceae bacterium]